MVLHLLPLPLPRAVILSCVGVLVGGQSEDPGPTRRAFDILKKQNQVLLGSVLGVLLLLMIIMAVCVYKPLSRR